MQFDIIIIGGGMVGAALANALRTTSYKIALIDAFSPFATEDPRLIALHYSSVCLLKNLHVWPTLHAHAAAIQEVHVSQRGHFGITRLRAEELKLPVLGYVIPAKQINAALYEQLEHITLFRPATLKQITQQKEGATLSMETPDGLISLSGKIIIGADGTHSTVRELLHIPTKTIDYQQNALVTITELQRPHHYIAYERFQQTGAIAMLPLVGNRVATIWTDHQDHIAKLMQLDDDAFVNELQKQFGYRLGRLININKRFVFPLHFIQAEEQIKQHVILIGNAAHTMHPIAAQGLNLALYEVATLYDHLIKQSFDGLSRQNFAAQQKKISLRLSHHLSWLFSHDFFIMNTARKVGMLGLDLCPTLKERFTRQALGQTGCVPSLLKEKEIHESEPSEY